MDLYFEEYLSDDEILAEAGILVGHWAYWMGGGLLFGDPPLLMYPA